MKEMTGLETIIALLCLKCSRRENVCYLEKPTWPKAYRCNYDRAIILMKQLDVRP